MEDQEAGQAAAAPIGLSEDKKIPNLKEIQEIISEIEATSKNSIDYFNKLSKDFSNKNDIFLKEINLYRDNMISKYSEVFNIYDKPSEKKDNDSSKNAFKMATEKHVILMNRINQIFSEIFSSIKQNMDIMTRFLDKFANISKNIDKGNPIQDFLYDEFNNIIDCWLFMKIDFGKFDFNQALNKTNLDQNFKSFVTKVSKNKNFNLKIVCPKAEPLTPTEQNILKEKKETEIKLLNENKANLTKLCLENADNVSNYIEDKIEFTKLKKLYIINSAINNSNLFTTMKNIEKLKIKLCPNIKIELLECLPANIKRLYLEKNNYVNYEFEYILSIFSSNKNILPNLEILSFAGNNLTRIDLSTLSSKIIFEGLVEMNFQKNKIYKFIYNPEKFPKLKFINCCKNNLNKSCLSDIKNLASLESGNGFLFEPELCEKYYNKLKSNLKTNENGLFISNYLNISFIPKDISMEYYKDFIINEQITIKLKKLDLSYNGLNCETFFKFVNQNKGFINLRSLNLNGNELDDTFFEKFMENNIFTKLRHLYLNSNRIGNMNVNVKFRDNNPIDKKYTSEKEKELVYKLRLIYNFIHKNTYLNKLTITKNPISEYYSVVPEPNNNADRNDKYIKKDSNNKIIINCLFSLLIKIRDELLTNEEEKIGRNNFNLRFDCRSNVNKNSENYPYSDKPIVYKK